MNQKWDNRDLKLFVEKKRPGEDIVCEEWTRHVKSLQEGEVIQWGTYSGMHRTPYDGDYTFTFLGAEDNIHVKVSGKTDVEIAFDDFGKSSSDWYEKDGYCYRVTLSVIISLYSVSELPNGVRTMQQTDHDAWDYAVRNGLI